jgi:nicotinate-nucleotide adenylyltransferase
MEVAIFGGTFDPPTRAHEAIIDTALKRTEIDELWVMPSGNRTDKPKMMPQEDRLTMLRLMKNETFQDEDRVTITDFEMRLPQPTQTSQTLEALKQAYPEHSFWFIFGADSYYDMPQWRDGERLQKELGMLLVPRSGYEMPVADNVVALSEQPEHLRDVSSTQVREKARLHQDISCFVCKAVASFLQRQHYYEASYN